jgi:hypothetical protein
MSISVLNWCCGIAADVVIAGLSGNVPAQSVLFFHSRAQ